MPLLFSIIGLRSTRKAEGKYNGINKLEMIKFEVLTLQVPIHIIEGSLFLHEALCIVKLNQFILIRKFS